MPEGPAVGMPLAYVEGAHRWPALVLAVGASTVDLVVFSAEGQSVARGAPPLAEGEGRGCAWP
jgi:hypothetical protein